MKTEMPEPLWKTVDKDLIVSKGLGETGKLEQAYGVLPYLLSFLLPTPKSPIAEKRLTLPGMAELRITGTFTGC